MDSFEAFHNSPFRNHWVELPGISVYFRKAHRLFPEGSKVVLDIGSVNVAQNVPQGRGRWKALLRSLQTDLLRLPHEYEVIMVENVINRKFELWFERTGWDRKISNSNLLPNIPDVYSYYMSVEKFLKLNV